MTSIERFDAALPHGITLSCRAAGSLIGAPRVLLLHGFPEGAFAWDEVMLKLADRARCTAPNLRGYERSSAPADVQAYRARHLVADIATLIERLGAPIDLLVAHDWGGALAWNLAALQPALLKRLLIVNAPHPATFLRELRDNPAQQAASAYMNFLCRPDAAALLAENDFARLWPWFSNGGGGAWLDAATRERYREVWRCGLEGALNYYRASPLRPPLASDDAIHTLVLPPPVTTVRVPTTVLWGEADIALPSALLDGLAAFVPDLDLRRVPGATHWIVHEQPALVAGTIVELLAATPPRSAR
ncbi:MAG TPA: alpha/beta fold hydrolase [Burkholderiaceae bacterium]|nr:alpha/beta fold hydrolase [Burkholderiaceae bacterium]